MINIVLLIMDNGQRQVGLALAAVHLQNVQVDGDIVRVILARRRRRAPRRRRVWVRSWLIVREWKEI